MTARTILAGGAIALWAFAPAYAQQTSGELALEIALRTYHVDERVRGSAGDHGVEPFQSYVWTSATLCQVAASDSEPASVPAIGWHFSGRVIERTGDEFLVSIEWRRLWFNSVRLTDGANGVMQVRMRTDRRLELDVVGPIAASSCGMAGARLEAAIVARPRVTSGGTGGGSAGAGAIRRGGAGGATGGGSTTSPQNAVVVRSLPNASFLAELWLIHKLPDGAEESQRYATNLGEQGAPFGFPPVSVRTDSGAVAVEVSGRITPVLIRDSAGIQLSIGRSVGRSMGGSFTSLPLPAPGEVLSFELPSPSRSQDPLGDHRFSLRLRLTPK